MCRVYNLRGKNTKESLVSKEYRGKLKPLPESMKGFSELIGAVVVDVGMTSARLEGGLAIDFVKNGGKPRRIVIGYTELGEWIAYRGPSGKKTPNNQTPEGPSLRGCRLAGKDMNLC